jgi:hypothetical protein
MANEMPTSDGFQGLSKKVLQYSEHFSRIVEKLKRKQPTDADWATMEQLIDIENYRRSGVFAGPTSETSTWQQYKSMIAQYGAMTDWEGTLRRITEAAGIVFLELEERNTMHGVMDVSNTVTIYNFNQAGKLCNLDVYVSPIGKRNVN